MREAAREAREMEAQGRELELRKLVDEKKKIHEMREEAREMDHLLALAREHDKLKLHIEELRSVERDRGSGA